MILLRSSREPGAVERIQSALEEAGVGCVVRNELTYGLAPEVPVTDATPEVWIVEEAQLPEAQKILAALEQAPAIAGPGWSCTKCGERLEAQFSSWWRCGASQG